MLMAERTADEMCMQQGSFVIGGKPRSYRLPSIRETAAARRKIGEMLGGVANAFEGSADGWMRAALPLIMADGLDTLIELPGLYAPELADAFENEASIEERAEAGSEVLEALFPLIVCALKSALGMVEKAKGAGLKI